MKYGCIGEHLVHSFSEEIHHKLADYSYELLELARHELDGFMKKRAFLAINVTIPYKQDVIPYLDEISERAKQIGAVNTIVNRSGKLYGYNTDFIGMKLLIERNAFSFEGKKVLIAGTGGTSRTAVAVAENLGASEVIRISRTAKEGAITYEEASRIHRNASFLINTTPCGMFPHCDDMPLNPTDYPLLEGVIDAIYNPLRSKLVLCAAANGIKAEGGLFMLVAQAVAASELFLGVAYPENTTSRVFTEILHAKENIVLTGMPGCGKTTIGRRLAKEMKRPFFDMDEEIIRATGRDIKSLFADGGEEHFRDIETEVLRSVLSTKNGVVIATGGGAVLREENVGLLRRNGKLYFLDRPIQQLLPTPDRPLASSAGAVRKRFEERHDRYCQTADRILPTDGVVEHAANEIRKEFSNEDMGY